MSRSLRQPLDFRPLFKLRLVVAAHGAWSAALVQDLPVQWGRRFWTGRGGERSALQGGC